MTDSDQKLSQFKRENENDPKLRKLKDVVLYGWPTDRREVDPCIIEYYSYQEATSVDGGLLLKGSRLIVPQSMRRDMLAQIHSSHLGIEKCKNRARDILFWPGMNALNTDLVSQCSTCNRYINAQPREPLLCHEIPNLPWQKVGCDLYQLGRETFLLLVHNYSKFVKVVKLRATTSAVL